MVLPPDINPDDYEIEHLEPLIAEEIPGGGAPSAGHRGLSAAVLIGYVVAR
jgi:hypothetical protein